MGEVRATVEDSTPELVIGSVAELDRLLDVTTTQAQDVHLLNIVFLRAANGDQLSLVVGGDETVLVFTHGHGNPPYFASDGASPSDEPFLTAYAGLVHHTEYPRRWVVPMSLGRKAAVEFLISSNRPAAVHWVET